MGRGRAVRPWLPARPVAADHRMVDAGQRRMSWSERPERQEARPAGWPPWRLRYESIVSLRPVGWVFLLFGAFWGGWAVGAIDVERALGVSNAGFGLLLSVALVGGASSNAVRRSTMRAIRHRQGTGNSTALLGGPPLWRRRRAEPVVLGAVIVVMVAVAGLVDVAINVAATAALADRLVGWWPFTAGSTSRGDGGRGHGGLLGVGASWRWMRWRWPSALAVGMVCDRVPLPAGQGGDQVPLGGGMFGSSVARVFSQWRGRSPWPPWWRVDRALGVLSCGPSSAPGF